MTDLISIIRGTPRSFPQLPQPRPSEVQYREASTGRKLPRTRVAGKCLVFRQQLSDFLRDLE